MKTEFIDVNETRKNLVVEIPSTEVDAEIDKVARDYGKAARIPGFRPGKVPAKVVRQRFRDQILHAGAHGLIPRAVDEALREGRAAAGSGRPEQKSDTQENVTVDIGAAANPPGFDDELRGLTPGAQKTFDVRYPGDYTIAELAGTTVSYDVNVKAVRKRIVPALDDEFAKDVGDFASLDALRARIREDLEHEARHEKEGGVGRLYAGLRRERAIDFLLSRATIVQT